MLDKIYECTIEHPFECSHQYPFLRMQLCTNGGCVYKDSLGATPIECIHAVEYTTKRSCKELGNGLQE